VLRPLARQVEVGKPKILDEDKTVERIADTGVWQPVLKPETELLLDVALVFDTSPSMSLWQRFAEDLRQVFSHYGIFRDLRIWKLHHKSNLATGEVQLTSLSGAIHNPSELLLGSGRRAVMIISDCVAPAWHDGRMRELVGIWSAKLPTAIIQVFPERLWSRTALARSVTVEFQGKHGRGQDDIPNPSNVLKPLARSYWDRDRLKGNLRLPVLTIELDSLSDWVRVVSGDRRARVAGIVWSDRTNESNRPQKRTEPGEKPNSKDLTDSFLLTASPQARELAGLLASAPVITLPIVRLVQRAMLPQSTSVHVAEVFMGGLLKVSGSQTSTFANAEKIAYQFIDDEVRDRLRAGFPAIDGLIVLERVSNYVAKGLGKSIAQFKALLRTPSPDQLSPELEFLNAFAKITAKILRGLGSEFAAIADSLTPPETAPAAANSNQFPLEDLEYEVAEFINFPPLQDFEYEPAQITNILERFEFETAEVEKSREIRRQPAANWGYTESLSEEIALEMVSIPGGSFIMGAPDGEPDSRDSERPQHEVTVPPFFIGRYPITQAQWRIVANWPQVERSLEPEPSRFKGDSRPVERVSWEDAVEFCQRLSAKTGRAYRLPSEAEWEYACRAIKNEKLQIKNEELSQNPSYPPFHFGEIITADLANYDARETYNGSPKGEFRGETTDVGIFPANRWGLYDMHGNVLEWCEDDWHSNYEGAPDDGSAWLEPSGKDTSKLLRGGCWGYYPWYCRSAYRYFDTRVIRLNFLGFRVCCVLPRTLLNT
jgi:formylglycine-generating enzyme required for sulfatase activity